MWLQNLEQMLESFSLIIMNSWVSRNLLEGLNHLSVAEVPIVDIDVKLLESNLEIQTWQQLMDVVRSLVLLIVIGRGIIHHAIN